MVDSLLLFYRIGYTSCEEISFRDNRDNSTILARADTGKNRYVAHCASVLADFFSHEL